jgi:hypothetical protein
VTKTYCFLKQLTEGQKDNPDISAYKVTREENVLTIGIACEYNGRTVDREIAIDTEGKAGGVWQIVMADADEYNELKAGEIFGQAGDRFSFFKAKVEGAKMAEVAFEKNGDINIFLYCHCPTERVDFSDVTALSLEDKTYMKHAAENSPVYAEKLAAYNLKGKFLNRVDAHNSIGYLETQTDVLTRALLDILPAGHPLYNYLKEADQKSSLTADEPGKVLSKLYGDKGVFRAKQAKYREDKEAAGIADAPPLLPPPPTEEELRAQREAVFNEAVNARLNAFAQGKDYDNMDKARLAILTDDYKPDGEAANAAYAATWEKAIELWDDVASGTLTVEAALAELPALVWPGT